MSFDANIGRPQPVIKPTAGMNNDGGSGGNTGYMMRGKKKNDEGSKKSLFDGSTLDVDCFNSINGISKTTSNPEIYEGSWFDKLVDRFIK